MTAQAVREPDIATAAAPAGGGRNAIGVYLDHRYAILFYSLLLTMAVSPLSAGDRPGPGIIEALLLVNLFAAILPIENPKGRRLLLAGFILVAAAQLAGSAAGIRGLSNAALIAAIAAGMLAAAMALRFVLRATTVAAEHIYAALSAYLLAGIFWGVCYWVVEQTTPGSMAAGQGTFTLNTSMYFSFVTLATLGYGDILPLSDAARSLAVVEAVAGQLYLAVLVARLVSLYVSKGGAR
jgi:voltage-gated potassium channel Kch